MLNPGPLCERDCPNMMGLGKLNPSGMQMGPDSEDARSRSDVVMFLGGHATVDARTTPEFQARICR